MECPSCYTNFNHDWDDFLFSRNEVKISVCPACHLRHVTVYVYGPADRYDVYHTQTVAFEETPEGKTPVVRVTFDCWELYMIPEIAFDYYKTPARKEIPSSVPPDLAKDFGEAHKIVRDSPRSAALLARRMLEKVLDDHGRDQDTLYKQLESLENSKELSSIDIRKLQAVRNLGNISAHTLVDVDTGEAELCLQIVDELFKHYYVTPAEVDRINMKNKTDMLKAGPID